MSESTRKIVADGITFDDVLIIPMKSSVIPKDVDTSTKLTKKIRMNIPIVSAAMDTVTESALSIALAQEGGIGIIHRSMTVENQVREVDKVKRSENGVIFDPVTLSPDQNVGKAVEVMNEYNISGVPIVKGKKLVGILTRRDLKFLKDFDKKIEGVMTKGNLVTASPKTTLEQAKEILNKNKVEKLLLVDKNYNLKGLITIKDIDKIIQFPNACRDSRGRLRVGAAAGVYDYERIGRLIEKDVDVIVVDVAHGHSKGVIETVKAVKKKFDIQVVAGNVATREGARDLIKAGADAVKVGIGPGAICTTRIISGVGIPQISALFSSVAEAEKAGVPIISDGGIRHSGDITKAIVAGAASVMIGSLFAGLEESPGEKLFYKGRTFKVYRGMGSLGAMVVGGAARYSQSGVRESSKLVPEGVEGRVPYKGRLGDYVYQLVGGLKAGMHYCGAANVDTLRKKARFIRVTQACLAESHPHNIVITKEAPNYRIEYENE